MSWRCHRLEFRVESPIQIGWHKLGTIIRTRYYVPARNIWGAWVGAWAREYGRGWGAGDPYRAAETELARWLRFTPLFVLDGGEWLRPRYGKDGLRYGGLTQGEFESKYVHGMASTAIGAQTQTAADGTLHEKEYLYGKGLRLGMYAMTAAEDELDRLWRLTGRFFLGGGTHYGYGHLRRRGDPAGESGRLFGEFGLGAGSDCVVEGERSAAVASFTATGARDLAGECELVSGREWDAKGSGQRVRPAREYWLPGSVLERQQKFRVDRWGYWEANAGEKAHAGTDE